MQGRYIPAIITLIAGLITSIICVIKDMTIIKSLSVLLVVLIIFYVIGLIAKTIVIKTLNKVSTEPQEDSDEVKDEE